MKLLEIDIQQANSLISITGATSLEHAMDLAIKKTAEEIVTLGATDYNVYRIRKVTFKTLEATVSLNGSNFIYKFEATIDEA